MLGFEMEVSLDFQTTFQLDALQFRQTDGPQLRTLKSKIAQAEKPIIIFGVHFRNQPGRAANRVEELKPARGPDHGSLHWLRAYV